jgi:hypothetical protein
MVGWQAAGESAAMEEARKVARHIFPSSRWGPVPPATSALSPSLEPRCKVKQRPQLLALEPIVKPGRRGVDDISATRREECLLSFPLLLL